jgi:acyl-CoA thioesterase-1
MIPISGISVDSAIWFCASGKSFFLGAALMIITAVIFKACKHKLFLALVWFLFIVSILAVVLSSTPLPAIIYTLWITAFIIYLLTRKKFPVLAVLLLTTVSITVLFIELPWHFPDKIAMDKVEQIYVIGDSISAGMGNAEERTWTVRLSEELEIPVVNLAVAGATASSALRKQVPEVTGPNNLVFLEIGGNDLLNHNSTKQYETDLMEIIRKLKTSSNQIIWFELPLLPQYYTYGRIQRKLAKQYNINVIPKSVLTTVFCTKNATSDGIHLTPKGHEIMKQRIQKLLHQKGGTHEDKNPQ